MDINRGARLRLAGTTCLAPATTSPPCRRPRYAAASAHSGVGRSSVGRPVLGSGSMPKTREARGPMDAVPREAYTGPFPAWPKPTEEECRTVTEALINLHGYPEQGNSKVVLASSPSVSPHEEQAVKGEAGAAAPTRVKSESCDYVASERVARIKQEPGLQPGPESTPQKAKPTQSTTTPDTSNFLLRRSARVKTEGDQPGSKRRRTDVSECTPRATLSSIPPTPKSEGILVRASKWFQSCDLGVMYLLPEW